jgi:hypothetical protein
MIENMLFETLKKLGDEQRKKESKDQQTSERKPAAYIYLDEKHNQIKEIPLSKLDSAASAHINKVVNQFKRNPVKLIHDFMFHY